MDHRDIYKRYNEISAIGVETTDCNLSYSKTYQFWKEHYISHMPSDKNSKIIELGSGLGNNLHALGSLGYKNVTGVEICEGSVELCKKYGLDVIQSDIISFLDENKNYYDVVILHHVLEHFTRTEALELLQKIKNILTENGIVLIAVPNGWNLFAAGALSNDITHEVLYSRNSLNSILQFSGFNTICFSTNIHTIYDRNLLKHLLKILLLYPLAFFGQLFTKILLISQGCMEPETKPNLVAIAKLINKN